MELQSAGRRISNCHLDKSGQITWGETIMSKNKRARTVFVKKSSVVATEIALAMMAAQIAYAQQPPEQPAPSQQPPAQAAPAAQPARTAAAEQVERIEITGTRL